MTLPRRFGWMAAVAVCCAASPSAGADGASSEVGGVAAAFEAGEAEDPTLRIETQLTGSEFAAAAAQAEQLIDAMQRATTRYDPALTRPLALLGDARLGLGDAPGALEAYDRALHIARINHGLFDPSQVDIVYREAVVHATMGDHATADARHEYAYNVLVRAYGANHPDIVPGLFARAEWLRARYNVFSARNLYRRAAKIGLREFPTGDVRTIRALRGVATTFRDERFPPVRVRERKGNAARRSAVNARQGQISLNDFSPGEQALIDVVKQLQGRPDATPEVIAVAMLELADWYLLFDKHSRAVPLYQRVWQLFEATPEGRIDALLEPTPLYLPLPSPPARPKDAASDTPEDGIVELAVTVTERGHVADVETLRSEPEGMMDHRVRRAARSARYRPTLTDGGPVPTRDVRIEYRFPHYPPAPAG